MYLCGSRDGWIPARYQKVILPSIDNSMQTDAFLREYTSHGEILKYTKATACFGINYLLEHDYKTVYLNALDFLPWETRKHGIRILEFGCGGGMNLLHLISNAEQSRDSGRQRPWHRLLAGDD